VRLRWCVPVICVVVLTAGCVQTPGSDDVDLIVPAEAGEVTDTVARAVAPCLADQLGVDVVVRNRPGENGVLGNREVAAAKPDGRTLMISSVGPTVVTPVLLPEKPYKTEDFTFLGTVHAAPVVLFTAADSPFTSAEQLLAAAKAGGQPVTIANRGDTTVEGHTVWLVNFLVKTRLASAPAGSDAELLRTVAAGDHSAGLAVLTPDLLSSIRSGVVRLLAVGGQKRPEYLPDAPTITDIIGRGYRAAIPDLVIDTAFSAPDWVGDAKFRALSSALEQCLTTDQVRRAIGTEFLPTEQITAGEQRKRYWDLGHAVQLGLNMAEIEGN
jgi:tripartite-type tricarboxylate transporter receptor subunit TctC